MPAGHRAGTRALRRTVEAAIDLGIETLVVYAFSTENWSRPAGEVADRDVVAPYTFSVMKSPEEVERVLRQIELHGDLEALGQLASVRQWLSPPSSVPSADS